MTTDITELAQSHELLIANGNETANLLRHLANNEIDSDYFAVVSECESYGRETEAELSITDFALRAARYVGELVEALEKSDSRLHEVAVACATAEQALEKAQQQNKSDFEIKARLCKESNSLHDRLREAEKRIAELESRTVKLPGWFVKDAIAVYDRDEVEEALTAAGIKWEGE